MRSILGVRPPIMPRWYVLRFHIPTSSLMITTMLGLSAALAGGGVAKAAAASMVIAQKSERLFMASSVERLRVFGRYCAPRPPARPAWMDPKAIGLTPPHLRLVSSRLIEGA